MDNLLIEARQKSAGAVYNDGDWDTTLSTPVQINEGDVVEVSKAFIDTVAEADDKMVIEKDITLSLDNLLYMTNYNIAPFTRTAIRTECARTSTEITRSEGIRVDEEATTLHRGQPPPVPDLPIQEMTGATASFLSGALSPKTASHPTSTTANRKVGAPAVSTTKLSPPHHPPRDGVWPHPPSKPR